MLLITAMIWGGGFVAQRLGMDSIGPLYFTAFRSIIAAVMLAVIAKAVRAKEKKPAERTVRKKTLKGGIVCGIILCMASNFQQVGLVDVSAGKTGFITAMYIVIVPILSIFLHKKTNIFNWIGVVLGVIGLYLLCVTGTMTMEKGDLVVLIGALFWALHILCVDHFAPGISGIELSAVQLFVCAALSFAAAIPFEEITLAGIWAAMLAILYCGIIDSGIGFTMQILGQQGTEPTLASIIMSTESLWATVFGFLLLGEAMTIRETAGCVFMFAAVLIAQRRPKNRTEQI